MKIYLITIFLGSIVVLATRIINEPLATLLYFIIIFWMMMFSVVYFKKYKRN